MPLCLGLAIIIGVLTLSFPKFAKITGFFWEKTGRSTGRILTILLLIVVYIVLIVPISLFYKSDRSFFKIKKTDFFISQMREISPKDFTEIW